MGTCCFIGHRKIKETEDMKRELFTIIENLIVNENADTFLFGSKSQFNSLCLDVTTELKEKYPHIKRIYVRAVYEYIEDFYKECLLEFYDDTYYPEKIKNSGKAAYVERNQEMIDRSDYCIFYYDENYLPPRRKYSKKDLTDYQPKSGTKLAYDYAGRKKKIVFNVFPMPKLQKKVMP